MKTLAWICLVAAFANLNLMAQDPDALRKERDKLIERGLWRDAVNFHEEKLSPLSDAGSGNDLASATEALGRLNAWKEFDGLVERAIATHPDNAWLLTSAAKVYRSAPHAGRIIAGEFERTGGYRYGRGRSGPDEEPAAATGQAVNTQYRDRVRALQLLRQATKSARDVESQVAAWGLMATN